MKKFGLSFCCEYAIPQEIIIQIELLNSKTLNNETSAIRLIGTDIGGISYHGNSSGDAYRDSNQLHDYNYLNLSLYYFYIFVDVIQGQIDETKDFLYITEDDNNIPLPYYLKECDQKRM